MSFFDRHIDAIETAAKIVFWGNLAIAVAIYLTGPVNMFTLAVMAAICVARLVLSAVEETRERMNRAAAERAEQWHERLRANREYELRRQIRRLQRLQRPEP